MTADAAVTPVELQIAARALGFMEKPLSGNVRLGIVYDPADAQSRASANAVVKLLGTGLKAGSVVFLPVLTNIDQAMGAPVDAFFLPGDVADPAKKISRATASRKLPCITLNIRQVRDGDCVLGINVDPKVEIYLNRAAAEDSGTTFVSVFRMMVTEF
jgi:hypothetical protein